MSARKKQSKFQNTTVFLLVEILILIDFYALTWWEKDTFKLGTSLVLYTAIFDLFRGGAVFKN